MLKIKSWFCVGFRQGMYVPDDFCKNGTSRGREIMRLRYFPVENSCAEIQVWTLIQSCQIVNWLVMDSMGCRGRKERCIA